MAPDPSADIASRKIVISYDLDPDPSAGLDFKGVITQGFRGQFILNSFWLDIEKVGEERKFSSQLWVRMAGYQNYIKYAGRKLNTLMWLRMAVEFMSIYICGYNLSSELWLRMAGYLNYLSSTYVFTSSFVSLTKYVGQKLNTLMWLRMAG